MIPGEEADDQEMERLLTKASDKSLTTLLPSELSYLITAFLPSQQSTHRSRAYLVLSAFCQGLRSSVPPGTGQQKDSATESLARLFEPLLVSRLADNVESDALASLSFLAALFQVDCDSASSIFQQDGFIDYVMDCLDLFPTASHQVARLLAQACGQKACRAIIRSHSLEWLEANSRHTGDVSLRAAAAVALVKMSRGAEADNADTETIDKQSIASDEGRLAKLMQDIVIGGDDDQSSLTDAIEGLAYLSVDFLIKESLANDPTFLSRLFSLVPHHKANSPRTDANSSLLYGVVIITLNLCAYPSRLTEEEAQIQRLKRIAKAGKSPEQNPNRNLLDDEARVKDRGQKLVISGALNTLTSVVRATTSRGIRANAGKALLALVENKQNRGKVLQCGGTKALMLIINQSTSAVAPGSKFPLLEPSDLDAIQALAKLAITSSPVQVFGPNEGAMFDAIKPLSLLLLHPSSSLLQRFEGIMALTNLASLGHHSAARIAKTDGLMNKVELLLLEDHTLIRRASMELICNLIAGSEEVFKRYGGDKEVTSKVQVLLAMSDVDDLSTRIAASGALATLTIAPSACSALFKLHSEHNRVLPVLTQLIDPSNATGHEHNDDVTNDPGLVHRGVVCVRNFLLCEEGLLAQREISAEAQRVGLVQALVNVVKGGRADATVLKPTAEILAYLKSKA